MDSILEWGIIVLLVVAAGVLAVIKRNRSKITATLDKTLEGVNVQEGLQVLLNSIDLAITVETIAARTGKVDDKLVSTIKEKTELVKRITERAKHEYEKAAVDGKPLDELISEERIDDLKENIERRLDIRLGDKVKVPKQ